MSETEEESWEDMLKSIDIFLADNRDQHYIFRGQSRHTKKIRSALHREVYGGHDDIQDDSEKSQSLKDLLERKKKDLLEQMRDLFFPGEHELEILTQLQHLGEPTNFIDFTDDYHVALFFACSTPEKSSSNPVIYFYHVGKSEFTDKNDVKLSKKMAKGNYVFRSSNQNNRIIAQRACFVHRKEGFLEIPSASIPKREQSGDASSTSKKSFERKSFYVEIKREWRQHIIDYLKGKDISYRTLFNDLEGHIRYRSSYETLTKLKKEFLAIFNKDQRSLEDYREAIALLEKMVKYDQVEAVVCASMFLAVYKEQKNSRADFNKLVKSHKRATMFYFLRSYFYNSKESQSELDDYDKIIELEPDFYQVYFNRGMLYGDLKKFDLALQDYNKALELKPDYAEAYFNRGNLYLMQEKFDLALKDYHKVIELKPDAREVYFNRGLTYEKQEKFDLALQDYNQAIELNPDYADAYNNRGNLYKELKKFDLALQDYNKALELKPDFPEAYYNRGLTYEKQEKFDLALQDYNKALKLKPDYAFVYNNRSNLYQMQEKFDLALKDYNKALELKPDDHEVYFNRGTLYLMQEKFVLALQDYNKAIKLQPHYTEAYNNRGLAYHNLEKFDLALKDYNKAIKLQPHYTEAYNNRGVTHEKRGKLKKALQDYNKAIELKPNLSGVYNNRDNLYRKQGKLEEALQDYNKALKPDYFNARNNRKRVLQKIKERAPSLA